MDQPDITDDKLELEAAEAEAVAEPAGREEANAPAVNEPSAGEETPNRQEFTTGAVAKTDVGALDEEMRAVMAEPAVPENSLDPLTRDVEALLFISPQPVSLEVLAEVTGVDGDELALAVETVREKFSAATGGIVFAEVAGGYTFRTNDQSLPSVERLCQRPADYTLSAAAMETLAIVAYLQPITRPEIARIRGVGADTVVANLLEKGLLEESGRSRDSGAVKYRTTRAFEKLFGLAEVSELPPVAGFDATPQDVEELRQKLHLAADKRQ